MKNDVLFITEKWCDGNEKMGLTNNFHNLFGSLENTNLYSSITLSHYDELYYKFKNHYDYFSEQILEEYNPNVVVVSHLGDSFLNPTHKTYKIIKNKNIKLIFIWPDTRDWVYSAINKLNDYADLHVSWACELSDEIVLSKNHIWMWTPQDSTLYYDDLKTIKTSFIGSRRGYNNTRSTIINYLLEEGIELFQAGGQREEKLSMDEYAKYIRTSAININFSESALLGTYQCKGRVFETIASNSLLLEQRNVCTRRRLSEGIHYVEFDTQYDLKDKIIYFQKNESERKEIAKNGFDVYNTKYSPTIFWKTIFEKLELL